MIDPHRDTQYICSILDGGNEPLVRQWEQTSAFLFISESGGENESKTNQLPMDHFPLFSSVYKPMIIPRKFSKDKRQPVFGPLPFEGKAGGDYKGQAMFC